MLETMLPLIDSTPAQWLEVALGNFGAVLLDHAHCEKKAAATAMSLVNAYPDKTDLVIRCTKLAQEELRHFRLVMELIVNRGMLLGPDAGDPYAKALLSHLRHGAQQRMTDRLLVAALIEARSCERLQMLADGLAEESLARFYHRLAKAESGHFRLFVGLAKQYDDEAAVDERLRVLAEAETVIMRQLPIEARIH